MGITLLKQIIQQSKPVQAALFLVSTFTLLEGILLAQLGEKVLLVLGAALPIFLLVDAVGFGMGAAIAARFDRCSIEMRGQFAVGLLVGLLLLGLVFTKLAHIYAWLMTETLGQKQYLLFSYIDAWGWFLPLHLACHGIWSVLRSLHRHAVSAALIFLYSLSVFVLTLVLSLQGMMSLEWHGTILQVAALFAFLVSLACVFSVVKGDLRDRPKIRNLTRNLSTLLSLISVTSVAGAQVTLANISVPVSAVIVNYFLKTFAPEALPSFALAMRIEPLLLVIFYSYSAVAGPVLLKNNLLLGGNALSTEVLSRCVFHCLKFGAFIWAVVQLLAYVVTRFLGHCPDTAHFLTAYLLWVPLSYGAYGVVMLFCAFFNARLQTQFSLLVCFTRCCVFLPMGAWVLGKIFTSSGVFVAIALSHALAAILSFLILYRLALPSSKRISSKNLMLEKE